MIIWDLIIFIQRQILRIRQCIENIFLMNLILRKIEELYENRTEKDEPFYLFNVTMQNHGGFDKTYSNFHNDIQITDNHKNEQAEQYLSLVKKTDDAV